MYQQVNLYQPVFRKQHKVFSSLTLLQISAVVLLLLTLIAVHNRWTLTGMQTTAQALELQFQSLNAHLNVLETGSRTPDSEVISLHRSIDQRHHLLQQFDQLLLQHRDGFASRFEALARLKIDDLWIQGVSVNNKSAMEIRGTTLEPQLVPIYLQKLDENGGLGDTTFETVSISRMANDSPQIQFVLRNNKGVNAWQ